MNRDVVNATAAAELPELVLQTGHNKLVRSVAISPDKEWVATGSFDSTIRIWSVKTGRELRSLAGHQGAVSVLACSPDGQLLASAGNDDTVRVWDVAHGSQTSMFTGKKGVTSLIFSGDGRRLISGDRDGHMSLIEMATAREAASISSPAGEITALATSPDGQVIVSGWPNGSISIWNTVSGKAAKTLTAHTSKVTVLQIDHDGRTLASAASDGSIRLWDLRTGRRVGALTGHKAAIMALTFASPDRLLSVDAQRSVMNWESSPKRRWGTGTSVNKGTSAAEIESAAFSVDASLLAVGNGDGTAAIEDLNSGQAEILENHTVGFYGVEFSRDGHWMAGAGFDNSVKLWDLTTGDSRPPLVGHTGRVTSVAFASKNRLVSASVDHTLRVWDLLTRKSLAVLTGHTNSVSAVAVDNKGTFAVSGGADGKIGIWQLDGQRPPRFLSGNNGEVIAIAISPDEQTIASGGMDGIIRLWNTNTGTQATSIEPKAGEIDAIAFSPDGSLIAAAGTDRTIRLWRTAGAELVRSMTGHTGKINSVSFSPDGRFIVSGGQDRSVHTWSVADGSEMKHIDAHAGAVFGATYSPDGRFIASASDDGSIGLWSADSGARAATVLSMKNGEWLAATPGGSFDGSPAGWAQLSWRFENNTFNSRPVEVFFSEYYQPGLLADLFSGRDIPQVSAISSRDRRQPELKLSVGDRQPAARTVAVTVDIASAPAGARDVRLFRNGALVKVWPGDVLAGRSALRLEATVPIVAGENRLTAYAFNNDNVKSSDAGLTIDGSASLARKGTLYLVAVGVNEYANAEFNLRYAVADADDFANEVQLQQTGISAYQKIEVVALRNRDANKAALLETLRRLSAKTQPEDGVIVYFAGHGIADKSRFYLVPYDLGYTGKRSQLNEQGVREILSSSISDEELEAAVRDIDAGQLLLVIDACNSGQVLETEEKRRGPMNSKGLAQLAYEKGMYILTAAQSYQAAQEAVKLGHGFLTFALVEEGLKTNAADDAPRDGDVTLREWLDFAAARVPQIQQEDLTARELTRDKSAGKPAIDERSIQRPRLFYRREADLRPFIVARH